MGLEYKLSDKESKEKLIDKLAPRNYCKDYVSENGGKAILIAKKEFDTHLDNNEFVDGPFRDGFGDGYGEPYRPNRQAYGRLKSGLTVYCELSRDYQKIADELLKLLQGLDPDKP